jgi:MerR family transcriptional regulator/heat shock protein HspR
MESFDTQGNASPQLIKIGVVARKFEVSVDLLRLYEREGLLIPLKSPKGTRYFTEKDFAWINTLMRLVRDSGLNFAGIRHLLALLPCWEMKNCSNEQYRDCPSRAYPTEPCWMNHSCCHLGRECYKCDVYRAASSCTNLKEILQPRIAIAAD